MRTVLAAPLILIALVATGCRHAPGTVSGWFPRSGTIVGPDTIVGRTYTSGRALLLSDRPMLIAVNIRGAFATYMPISNRGTDVLWGLARSGDGSLWTLAGQRTLGRIDESGRISERIPLTVPHVGLFGSGGRLVYQVLSFDPPVDALVTGPPGEQSRRSWGGMKTRRYALARASVAALNLVLCGGTETAETPCWFPDEPAVTLVNDGGASRRVSLPELPTIAPEILLTAENPPRPVRDVFVAASGDLWVLGSGLAAHGSTASVSGGRLLARYSGTGRLIALATAPAAVRLILHAAANRCLVLAVDGHIVEVRL